MHNNCFKIGSADLEKFGTKIEKHVLPDMKSFFAKLFKNLIKLLKNAQKFITYFFKDWLWKNWSTNIENNILHDLKPVMSQLLYSILKTN